jgi:hypothetical protein
MPICWSAGAARLFPCVAARRVTLPFSFLFSRSPSVSMRGFRPCVVLQSLCELAIQRAGADFAAANDWLNANAQFMANQSGLMASLDAAVADERKRKAAEAAAASKAEEAARLALVEDALKRAAGADGAGSCESKGEDDDDGGAARVGTLNLHSMMNVMKGQGTAAPGVRVDAVPRDTEVCASGEASSALAV